MTPQPLVTLEEAADYLRLAPDTVSRKARAGLIEYRTTDGGEYRFKQEWLDDYLEEHTEEAAREG